jgi:feruloyl esterase
VALQTKIDEGGLMRSYIASVVLLGLIAGAATAADSTTCTIPALQKKAPKGVTILSAKANPQKEKIPAHCFVTGNVATPGNVVDFQLALPTNWNGKFIFQGVGGFAGSMAKLDNSIERGYAAATTDTGHQGGGTDGKWALNNRPKEIDYGYRGTHVSAIAAQQLTHTFYGSKPRYRYFNGCSNGGRQALMEAQRYPDDFDGIIAGDPSVGAMGYVRRGLTYQFMLKSPDRVLPAAKLDLLSKAATAACDASDGLKDGLIGDPRRCTFDPAPLLCKNGDAADCLTAGQIESIKMIYADTVLPNGGHLPGMPVGHEAGKTGWPQWISGSALPIKRDDGSLWFNEDPSPTGFRFADGFFRYMAFEEDDPAYDWRTFDLQRDLPKIETIAKILSPVDANLKQYGKNGKKLLLYHGWSDPAISAYGTINYYNNVVNNAGGKQKADGFVRLFLAPGMHHCRGGPGPDTFDAIGAMEQWVEKGVAPDKLIATHSTDKKVDRTRPLCPEPQVAKYSGTGSIDAAENFRCEAPAK